MRRYRIGIRGREFVIDVDDVASNRFTVIVGEESSRSSSRRRGSSRATMPAFAPAGIPRAAPAARSRRRRCAGPHLRQLPSCASRRPERRRRGCAPMPGVVVEISVKPGDTVVRGQQVPSRKR
jgi:biotin carboxyl carrier protein